LRARGWLGAERAYGPVTVAVGDGVICRRNDREVDVDNGTRGTERAVHRTKIVIETDACTIRELPAAYVAGHVEHAYALTGHGMQGATVEWAGVAAAPHELTRGWSYTALSRARARTRLFVQGEGEAWAHHELARRDEHAPGEREDKPTPDELAARVARYMGTRDDEDLAVEQLPPPAAAGRGGELEPAPLAGPPDQEQDAQRAEPGVLTLPSLADLDSLTSRVTALEAQLASLQTPELERLRAAARRERALIAHHDELAERLARLPPPGRVRRDPHAVERHRLQQAIAGAERELAGVRALRARLEREVGPLHELLAERASLHEAIATTRDHRQAVRDHLIESAVAEPPGWATALLVDRPSNASARRVYQQALAAIAGYRLDHQITGPDPLGPPPEHPFAHRDYRHTAIIIERAQQRLALTRRPHHTPPPQGCRTGTAPRWAGRARRQSKRSFRARANAARAGAVIAWRRRSRPAKRRSTRSTPGPPRTLCAWRTSSAEHRQEALRAHKFTQQARPLRWRQRSERQRLLDTAATLRGQVERHRADVERIELELARLTATGRHPDQWLEQHAHAVADGLGAEAEHEQRRHAEIDRQASRAALDPPAHVRELLGDRPTDAKLAQAWQRLATALERNRLQYVIDVAKDGPLGPSPTDPTVRPTIAYRHDRDRLSRDIGRLRHQRGLGPTRRSPTRARAKRPTGTRPRTMTRVKRRASEWSPQ
jgi:cell division protein FtsB